MMDENEQSTVETVTEKAGEAASAVGTGAKKVVSAVAENPVLAAAGAAAVGAAVGGTALGQGQEEEGFGIFEEASARQEELGEDRDSTLACQEVDGQEVDGQEVDHWKVDREEVDDTRGGFKVEDPQAHGEVHCQEVNGGQEDLFFQVIATG